MDNDIDLHTKVCETLGITRQELADRLGMSKSTIDSWSSDNRRMSEVTKVALVLMLENYAMQNSLKNIAKAQTIINKYAGEAVMSNKVLENSDEKQLIDRINYILKEYDLTCITGARKLGNISFEQLSNILKYEAYPTYDFLEHFAKVFEISYDWLLQGNVKCLHPFSVDFIKSNTMQSLMNEATQYETFIIHCDNNSYYTKIILKDNKSIKYNIFRANFCIGKDYWMENSESNDLYDLYKFYKKYNSRLLQFNEDDYKNILSKDYYIGNIIKKGRLSYMLDDLFDLNFNNSSNEYGDFFKRCKDIIKYMVENKK